MYLISQSANPINCLVQMVLIWVSNDRADTVGLQLYNSNYCSQRINRQHPTGAPRWWSHATPWRARTQMCLPCKIDSWCLISIVLRILAPTDTQDTLQLLVSNLCQEVAFFISAKGTTDAEILKVHSIFTLDLVLLRQNFNNLEWWLVVI